MDRDISRKHKLIFIHIPKNAGTSVRKVLGLDYKTGGHYTALNISRIYPMKWKYFKKFAIIRNPYDRLVSSFIYAKIPHSYWHNSENKHPDFELLKDKDFPQCCRLLNEKPELFKHESWLPQMFWIQNYENKKILVDFVLKYENLEKNFKELASELKLNITEELPKLNTIEKPQDHQKYYDDETRELARKIYQRDFDFFETNNMALEE
jgi:hypothetical protein